MDKLNVDEDRIRESTKFFDALFIIDHLNHIHNALSQDESIYRDIIAEVKRLTNLRDPDEINRIEPNFVKDLIGSQKLNDDSREALQDLEFLSKESLLDVLNCGVKVKFSVLKNQGRGSLFSDKSLCPIESWGIW